MTHQYHFATRELKKAGRNHLAASAVIVELTVLGGRKIFEPIAIRGGLSDETLEALRKDMVRSFGELVELKPLMEPIK